MEKPAKKEMHIIIAVSALVIFAWLCRWVPDGGEKNAADALRAVIYLTLICFWAFTLKHRLIHPQVRHLAMSIALLMLFWFAVRTVKFCIPEQYVDIIRFMWYLYYLPMTYIPTLAVFLALTVGMPDGQRLLRRYNILWFTAAAIFLLVMTNDLHQLVFTFPDNGKPRTDLDYKYSYGYYVYAAYVVLSNLIMLVVLLIKSRSPGAFKWRLVPAVPFLILMAYWTLYILKFPMLRFFFGDLTAFSCVMYAVSLELCIRCGLIRSNTGYIELFKAGSLRAQIADKDGNLCLSGTENQPALADRKVLLKSKEIDFGHVIWREDVSEITDMIEEVEENCRELAERNLISRQKLEAEKTMLALKERSHTVDVLQKETAGQVEFINDILNRYRVESDENERRRLLAGATAAGAYIKRYGNLLMVGESSDISDIADLAHCFNESFMNMELMGINCLCTLPQDVKVNTGDMMHIYRTFEEILEDCLFELKAVWVNGREQEDLHIINIDFVCDKDISKFGEKADDFFFESGTSRYVFRIKKGGAENEPV